ncbi:chloride channel protein [Streptococcus hyovaginalis]
MNQHQKAMTFLSESILFLVFRGILVGLLAGSVVSLFRFCIQELSEGILSLYALAHQSPVYLGGIALAYLLILVLVGHLMATEPHIKGSGIPQIEAELKGFMHLDWWSVLWKKFLAGILTISSGMLLGREGPSIQLGAMVGKGVAERLRLTSFGEKTLVAGGSAAGVDVALGARWSGVFFFFEKVFELKILRDLANLSGFLLPLNIVIWELNKTIFFFKKIKKVLVFCTQIKQLKIELIKTKV